jgi:diguanylate cyclase (GGDEF)-like protein/PAS domain S-box-containing protein
MNELTNRLLRFRTAMDATRDAIYLVDRTSLRFIDVNASACSMLGLSREEILAAGPASVLGYSAQELAGMYDEVIADGGVSAPVELLRERKSGKQAWVEIQRHAQRSDDGWMIVTVARDITERKKMEDQVRQLAFYDPLTKLANRRLLNDRLGQAIATSKRSGCYGALIFLDLDNFKSLNDTHGHGAGDLLLIEAASRLTSCVREIDTVARLGGDEFVVVVGDLDDSKGVSTMRAASITEKIRKTIAEPYLLTVKDSDQLDHPVEHRCTASIGVVVFKDSEGTQEDFLRWADAAMYEAKGSGSNMIRFAATAPAN